MPRQTRLPRSLFTPFVPLSLFLVRRMYKIRRNLANFACQTAQPAHQGLARTVSDYRVFFLADGTTDHRQTTANPQLQPPTLLGMQRQPRIPTGTTHSLQAIRTYDHAQQVYADRLLCRHDAQLTGMHTLLAYATATVACVVNCHNN